MGTTSLHTPLGDDLLLTEGPSLTELRLENNLPVLDGLINDLSSDSLLLELFEALLLLLDIPKAKIEKLKGRMTDL